MSEDEKKKNVGNLPLSSYLRLRKHKGKPRISHGKPFFEFDWTPQLEKDINDYFDRKTSVDALTFIEAYFTCRALSREASREVSDE